VKRVVRAFEQVLSGAMNPQRLAAELKNIAPQGTTEGSLYVAKDYRLFPILQ